MKKYRISGISGSTKTNSTNEQILRTIAKLYDTNLNFEIFTGIAELPHFNSDFDTDEPPASVQNFRALIAQAAGVIIATPEYVFSLPAH